LQKRNNPSPAKLAKIQGAVQMSQAETKRETAIESVKMEDGRVVDFSGKRRMLKESLQGENGEVQVRLDFRNGQTRLFTIPQEMLAKFAAHGAEQKLGDETAGLTDIDDAVLAVDDLIDRLYNGEWTQKRAAGGMAGASILAKALMELTGKSAEEIKTFLSGKSPAEKTALRNNAKLQPIVARLEAEKAAKAGTKVDTDSLLEELES